MNTYLEPDKSFVELRDIMIKGGWGWWSDHFGAIFGGFVPLVLTFVAERYGTGLAAPMKGTWIGCLAWATAAFYGPETKKGKLLVPDLGSDLRSAWHGGGRECYTVLLHRHFPAVR